MDINVKNQVIAMWNSGSKIYEIIRVMPCSEKKAKAIIKEMKDNGDLPKCRPRAKDIVLMAYSNGMTNPYEIAEKYGYSVKTIKGTLTDLKLNRGRPAKNYKKRKSVEFSDLCQNTQDIVLELKNGVSPRDISRKYNISTQHIYKLKEKYLDLGM